MSLRMPPEQKSPAAAFARNPKTIGSDAPYEQKFKNLLKAIEHCKKNDIRILMVANPWVVGDTLDEVRESLSRLAGTGIGLHVCESDSGSGEGSSKTITVKNEEGETIEVKRGKDHGVDIILVRHLGKDAQSFGEFNTIEMLAKDPKAWDFLAKKGFYTNSELGKDILGKMGASGFLVIDGSQLIIGPQDGELILKAIKQLDEQEI